MSVKLPPMSPKYAAILLGVTTQTMDPMAAARIIVADLEASGVDVAGALASARLMFSKSQSVLDALDAMATIRGVKVESQAPKKETIQYRIIRH